MKKIAIFTGYYLPHLGGVERYTANMCEELYKLGYKPIIITSNHDNSITVKETSICTIYRLPIFNIFKERYPIIRFNEIYKELINRLNNDDIESVIINTRFYTFSLLGAKFAKRNNIPSCIIEHGTNHIKVMNKFIDFLFEIYEHLYTMNLKRYVKDFYGVSKGCTEWLKHFKINAKGIFYNSINGDDFEKYENTKYNIKDKTSQDIVITYASRIIKEKGILNLIDAFNIVNKSHKNIKLIVAGEGPLLDEVLNSNKDNKNIIFTGKLTHDEMMSLYNSTDIFVHPSMYPEGLPTSILEAGLMKCAIIATNRGGTIEVIDNNINGLIVEENVNDLVKKLEKLLDNKNIIEEYKEKIHTKIQNEFSWNNTVKTIIKSIKFKQMT